MDLNPSSDTEAKPVASSSPSGLAPIFLGPNGLRAGWRFAIYVIAFLFLLRGVFPFLDHSFFPRSHGMPPLWVFFVWEFESTIAAVVPALLLSRLEKRSFDSYGLAPKNAFGKSFWAGAVWGLVAITCLLGALRGIGVFYFGGIALHGFGSLKYAAFWAVLFVLVGLAEEFSFRGYSQF